MLKGKYPNDTLKRAHKTFVKTYNKLFKVTDRSDLLQEEHNKTYQLYLKECEEQLPLDATIEEANQCMMKTLGANSDNGPICKCKTRESKTARPA